MFYQHSFDIELPEDLGSRWKELVEGPLSDLNTKNATQIVCNFFITILGLQLFDKSIMNFRLHHF